MSCLICTDERQWVAPSGQRWTMMAELATAGCHCDLWEEEPGLLGVAVNPLVGIGQRGPAKTRFGILPRKPRPCPRHWLEPCRATSGRLSPAPPTWDIASGRPVRASLGGST